MGSASAAGNPPKTVTLEEEDSVEAVGRSISGTLADLFAYSVGCFRRLLTAGFAHELLRSLLQPLQSWRCPSRQAPEELQQKAAQCGTVEDHASPREHCSSLGAALASPCCKESTRESKAKLTASLCPVGILQLIHQLITSPFPSTEKQVYQQGFKQDLNMYKWSNSIKRMVLHF
ncbi:hypothetical protein EK904_003645 [Melospiza melodia maxima]|nr:hypothetical protein EK904_003645 [Melospiza melodia maxima]